MVIVAAAAFIAPISATSQKADTSAGSRTFSTNCSGCHGSDGRGGERAPNIATTRTVVAMTNKDLQAVVEHGIAGAGMPSFRYLGEQGITDLVGYLRLLQGLGQPTIKVAGDAATGRAIFFGKGGCSRCHMVAGEGGFIAPDLSGYGVGVSQEAIRRAIEEPDSHLQRSGTGVVVLRTAQGQQLLGLLRSEDNFNLVIQTEDGQFNSVSKSNLADIRYTSHSLMPRDFAKRLTSGEIQDLTSFLVTNSAATPESARPEKHEDDE